MPIFTSLIGTPEQIKYLDENLEIIKEPNKENKASIQTKPLCLFFEREDRIVIGTVSAKVTRVATLPSREFIGFSQSPGGYIGSYACLANYFQPEWFYHSYGWFLKKFRFLSS